MKINFKSEARSQKPEARRLVSALHPSSFILHPSRRGIALVITLIMLAVTLVMAIAFLAVARRERNAVTTTTDTTTARLATDTALAAAQAQIAANIFATNTGLYNYGLLVSTNFINAAGLNGSLNPTNVNYDYLAGGGSLGAGNLITNIANLYLLPRAPVYPIVNQATGAREFRFYLDLNRNGQFETNNPSSGTPGDPEWVGVLERPDQPHSANNHFLARYAFLAQPAGNSLDLNFIHNQTMTAKVNPAASGSDGYFRNEDVGSWELNLAAFLSDLNTNSWGQYLYNYGINSGAAFDDARALLSYRYDFNYNNQAVPSSAMNSALSGAGIDGYTFGNLMTNTALPLPQGNNLHWAGSDNTNRYFSLPADLFDLNKVQNGVAYGFTNRLRIAGNGITAYDRYTFYRMLDQLGTDSTEDDSRMNLNYRNVTNGVVVPGMETNCYAWSAIEFFTNAANRLLTNYTAQWLASDRNRYVTTFNTNASFGVTSIPVLVGGQFVYTPAVNRLLQLAANIYDATTSDKYPSVFRPIFLNTNGNIFITGYSVATTADLYKPIDISAVPVGTSTANVYGVPWIVGAKKGLPNFNQYYMLNGVQVTRKLRVIRSDPLKPGATATNEMFIMSITNQMGYSFWNSYSNNYTGSLKVYFTNTVYMLLTNQSSSVPWGATVTFGLYTNFASWPGWNSSGSLQSQAQSFITGSSNYLFLSRSIYRFGTPGYFEPLPTNASQFVWQTNYSVVQPFPQFGLMTTNWLQAYILDGNHVIDYVQLSGPNSARDLSDEIKDPNDIGNEYRKMWSTNGNPISGVLEQLAVSRNPTAIGVASWPPPPDMPLALNTVTLEGKYFDAFFSGNAIVVNGKSYSNTNLAIQAPYTPTCTVWDYTLWGANDPLVHYLASDLNTTNKFTGLQKYDDYIKSEATKVTNFCDRYQPWGVMQSDSSITSQSVITNAYDLRFRDPLVWSSDYWNFPTGKYPAVGWLGRVHRGTPWQTVYLKQRDVLQEPANPLNSILIGTNTWVRWTGDTQRAGGGVPFDAVNSAPVQDRNLFDLFSVVPNANATHGTLSVNQTGLAAWSAVFSGLVVPNNLSGGYTNILPAGADVTNSALWQLVNGANGINATRTNASLFPILAFTHVGDVLNAAALTEQSPFLKWNDPVQQQSGISDALYEWLPQQTLGLLRASGTPRYVVYCYGQTLRPAPNSLVLDNSGGQFGLCTNYQVTAESAARAVIRVNQNVVTNNAGVAIGTNYSTVVESFNVLPPN